MKNTTFATKMIIGAASVACSLLFAASASASGWRGAVEKRSAIMSYLIRMQKPRIAARLAHTQRATVLIVDDVRALGHDKFKVIGR